MTERTRADEVAPPVAVDSGTRRGLSRLSALAAWLRTAVVAAAQQRCQKQTLGYYIYRHLWWTVKIPCDRVRL